MTGLGHVGLFLIVQSRNVGAFVIAPHFFACSGVKCVKAGHSGKVLVDFSRLFGNVAMGKHATLRAPANSALHTNIDTTHVRVHLADHATPSMRHLNRLVCA